jgi:hypothetical protein
MRIRAIKEIHLIAVLAVLVAVLGFALSALAIVVYLHH